MFNNWKSFELDNFLKTLTDLELFAFISLCFNSVILNAVVSIVFIYYGEILIKYFKLETKYPTLAKVIVLRRKIHNFSVKYSLFMIFICVLPQLFISIVVFWQYFF